LKADVLFGLQPILDRIATNEAALLRDKIGIFGDLLPTRGIRIA
jgi:hypothetical protein